MKYIFGIITIALIVLSFTNNECKHIFTEVESPLIRIEQLELREGGVYRELSWPSGIQNGKDIVCVKCFHVQKQKVDYGQSRKQDYVLTLPESLRKTMTSDNIDTIGTKIFYIKGDTLLKRK